MDQVGMMSDWNSVSEDFLVKNFPVHRACRDGDVEHLTSLLLSGNIDLYEEDDFYGWTPVHWAAYFGKLQCLMHLLTHGGSCDVPTERLNQTPAHIAAYGGHCHCLKWLLHCGATINRQLACLRRMIHSLESVGVRACDLVSSRFSQTPLHLCAYGGHPQCLYWLVQCKGNLNAQDYMGETPMHKAARTGSMECISLLVSQGAKLSIRNYSGNTASQVAATSSYAECANYIERAAQIQCQSLSGGSTHFISTNTYHSHPHIPTNDMPQNANDFNMNNNNSQSETCDMEMGEGHIVNGNCSGAPQGDILLHEGVSQNLVGLAGRKRGREDVEEESYKRARNDDSLASKCKLNGWLFNNGHVTPANHVTSVPSNDWLHQNGHVTRMNHVTPVSDSMVEHYSSITLQQGYDSMMLDSVISDAHGF